MKQNELMHYGVVGMHWGIRRYQPYGNGGYMPKGDIEKVKKAMAKARSARTKADDKPSSKRRAAKAAKAEAKARETRAKVRAKAAVRQAKYEKAKAEVDNLPWNRVKSMSDKELASAILRKKSENEYVKLHTSNFSDGNDFLENLAIAGASAAVTGLAITGGKKLGEAGAATFLHKTLAPEVFKAIYPKK